MTVKVKEKAPSLAESVFDCLNIEGGWITAACLAMLMKKPEESVRRILYRLRSQGMAASRTVELAQMGYGPRPHRLESRVEWRAL